MKNKFAATAISRTRKADGGTLEITLADAAGRETVIKVAADMAQRLAQELGEFAKGALRGRDAALTKRPKSFAVGTGRYDNLVLIRFEDDAPYALDAIDAMDLGEALLEQSESVADRPEKVLQ